MEQDKENQERERTVGIRFGWDIGVAPGAGGKDGCGEITNK
jgi:hypothetical protein